MQKANYASLALKQEQEPEQAADAEDEEELQARALSKIGPSLRLGSFLVYP